MLDRLISSKLLIFQALQIASTLSQLFTSYIFSRASKQEGDRLYFLFKDHNNCYMHTNVKTFLHNFYVFEIAITMTNFLQLCKPLQVDSEAELLANSLQ